MVTISLFLRNTDGKNLPSVCFAVTLGSRTLSLLMDAGEDHAFRFSCRAGTEPAPTRIRKHPEPTFRGEDASGRASN
jgi:hypothetical protein